MTNPIIQPIIRRAILDLLEDVGGEHNDMTLQLTLNALGHRIARADVVAELQWLGSEDLASVEQLEMFTVATITSAGRDIAQGLVRHPGVNRHKTGA